MRVELSNKSGCGVHVTLMMPVKQEGSGVEGHVPAKQVHHSIQYRIWNKADSADSLHAYDAEPASLHAEGLLVLAKVSHSACTASASAELSSSAVQITQHYRHP